MNSGAPRAPLLAVVGGPTGSGKSTLLNSLVRAPVSAAGVLRPTTRRPVLVCNPRDWASVRRHGLRPICAPLMPAGIAVIDAPDIDSIEPGNRALAEELFAEADLWLFVTTASRYADAANWRHLRAARERRVALAVVLDRVAAGHAQGIIDHMRDLLGPPEPPLFVIPEATLDRQGMLPDAITAPLRGWLADVVEAARTGPPQPAIGVAHVPVESIATPADLVPTDAASNQDSAAYAEPVTGSFSAFGGEAGLTVELELTPAPQAAPGPTTQAARGPAAEPPVWPASLAFGTPPPPQTPPARPEAAEEGPETSDAPEAPEAEAPEAEAADPQEEAADPEEADTPEVGTSAPDASADTPDAAERTEDADGDSGVVESDPPDGRPADIPKAADVGETVKL